MIELKRFPDDGMTIAGGRATARELGVIGFVLLAFALVSALDYQDQQKLIARQEALASAEVSDGL